MQDCDQHLIPSLSKLADIEAGDVSPLHLHGLLLLRVSLGSVNKLNPFKRAQPLAKRKISQVKRKQCRKRAVCV